MVILNNFCACCSLKVGAIIIGAIGIVNILFTFLILLVKYLFFDDEDQNSLYVFIISSVILSALLVVSILLICGANKEKRWCVMPWIVLDIISSVVLIITALYVSVEYYMDDEILSGTATLITGLIILTIKIYFCVVVVSFYQFLGEGD